MSGPAAAGRLAGARAVLTRAGLSATVAAAGGAGEIAVVRIDPGLRADVARLAPDIRALGFRYVAIELDPPIEPGAS